MFHSDPFPNNLIQQYFRITNKLKKFERVVFKRFAPNVAVVSSEFNRLALKFDDASIFQYAGMCFFGSAKCEKSLGNTVTEVDFLLKSARSFVKADQEIEKLFLRTNKREYVEGALKSYNEALSRLDDDSVLKAAVIREIQQINPNFECTSSFSSPCHRIYDLELSSNENIQNNDYVTALEKLTDIIDNITERKTQILYLDVLNRTEITRLLLLLILNLPPIRQSPSHIKLLEKYSSLDNNFISEDEFYDLKIPIDIQISLKDLVMSWMEKYKGHILKSIEDLLKFSSLTKEHRHLLEELSKIYSN